MRAAHIIGCVCVAVVACLALAGCARMGNPDGGWYDDTPPRILSTTPADKGTGVSSRRIAINFDEYIKLEDASNKVVVSPPQLEMPEIKAAGKRIIVDLKDSLKPATTYTVDFSDAISDNNEGNPMGSYTYSFSTGDHIDTLEVAGYVLDASNLEPVKGILVGLHADFADSAFTTQPLLRVSRTDSRGHFTIKGVAPGTYRAFALQDADGNYVYSQKSEMIAFSNDSITPYCRPDVRQDTIWRDTLRIDSIARVGYIHHYPDNIVLRAFTALQSDRYLLKTERQDERRIGFYFTYGHEQLPDIRGLNFDASTAFIPEPSEKRDTVYYWLRDTALVNQDTLRMEVGYHATDTLGQLRQQTDTLELVAKTGYEKRQKALAKEREKWQKQMEKARKDSLPYDTVMPVPNLDVRVRVPSPMSPIKNVAIESPTPLARLDTAAIHLYSKLDTLWYRARFELDSVPGHLRSYTLRAEWRPGVEYSLEIDSAAFEDIYGSVSGPIKQGVRVSGNDAFSSLSVQVGGVEDTCAIVVQLLNASDAVVREARLDGGAVDFFYLPPGTYYLRAFADANANGAWDTGDYQAGRQAEKVYYNPKKVECKAKWDVTTQWNLTATPPERQKPGAITKQKPDKEKRKRNRNAERAASLGIKYTR